MSNNPVSFRLPPNLSGKADPDVVETIGWHDDAINDLQQAIPHLKSQITTVTNRVNNQVTTVSGSTTPGGSGGGGGGGGTTGSTIGKVNNQIGQTAYATQQSDYGAFILLGAGGPIDVSLTGGPAIQLPWFANFWNMDSSVATLMPDSGLINYPGFLNQASMPLDSSVGATVAYDGSAYWAVRYLPT